MAPSERYLRLTSLAQRSFEHGRLDRALRLFESAEDEARRSGDRELCDRAFCNRCAVLAEMDRLHAVAGELKHVLMRARDPFTSWLAAYYTSQSFEIDGNLQRALAYARRAADLAGTCGRADALAASANQRGVLALKDAQFGEAAECFRTVLAIDDEAEATDSIGQAITRDNLGYCLMCTGEPADGMELCATAATTIEDIGARQYLAEIYQDLCYGSLQLDRFADACEWGEKALAFAAEYDHETVERNTLMLLADAAMDAGDDDVAGAYIDRLSAHYPDFRGMRTFFEAFNVRDVINLKA